MSETPRPAERLTVLNVGQNYYVRGGSDRYLLSLGHLLERHGHRVIPFAARNPRNEATEWASFFPEGADFEHPGPLDAARFVYSPAAAKALTRLLRTARVDLAHLHIYYGKLTASILEPLRRAGIPVVQTLHDFKLICPVYSLVSHGRHCEACQGRHYWRALPRTCNRGSLARTALSVVESYTSRALGSWSGVDHFMAVSDFQREKLVRYGIASERISTVPLFVDPGDPPATEPGQYFLYFGRLEGGKGVHTLLSAAQRYPDVPLVIAGDGGERAALEERIAREKLTHVRLIGFQGDAALADLIRGAICTIMPSEWYETFGLTLLESHALGRPVIASATGGTPEAVVQNVDGFLVPPGDVNALAERMGWMAAHRGEALTMGQAGRAKVEARFSPERHYQQVLGIYRRVLGDSC
jgi:glycosyltransferase involved in cell wall biosynthesis